LGGNPKQIWFLPATKNPNLKKGDHSMKIKSNVKAGQAVWGA
jgi:hypothetical protein